MAKTSYKKARKSLIAFKSARVVIWLRLFFTLIAFICSFIISGLSILRNMGVHVDDIINSDIGDVLAMVAFILLFDPFSIFTLVYCGAYSSLGLVDLLNLESVDGGSWLTTADWTYKLIVIGGFVLGFLILLSLFKALKKTKRSSGFFVWIILILAVETFLCITFFGVPTVSVEGVESLYVYLMYFMNVLSLILCCRAMSCANYLQDNFKRGAALKLRELKRLYHK